MPHISSALLKTRREIAFDMRGEEVEYNMFSRRDISLKTGEYIETFTDSTISECLVGWVDEETIKRSEGKYHKQDRVFRFKTADLPEDPPSVKSQITYSSTVWKVIGHDKSADGNVILIYARKL